MQLAAYQQMPVPVLHAAAFDCTPKKHDTAASLADSSASPVSVIPKPARRRPELPNLARSTTSTLAADKHHSDQVGAGKAPGGHASSRILGSLYGSGSYLQSAGEQFHQLPMMIPGDTFSHRLLRASLEVHMKRCWRISVLMTANSDQERRARVLLLCAGEVQRVAGPSTKLALLQGFARGLSGPLRLSSSSQELPMDSAALPAQAQRAAQPAAQPGMGAARKLPMQPALPRYSISQLSPRGILTHSWH